MPDDITMQLLASMADMQKSLSDKMSEMRAEFSKEFDKLREDQKSANEALDGLAAWRIETTKSLEGAVSSIDVLTTGQASFTRETVKLRGVEARLEKAEQMIRNFQIQADIGKNQRDIIMPRLNTNNRSEVFSAVQKNLMKLVDSLGFSTSLIGIRPMGPGIGCLNFPSSVMRDKAFSSFRQVSPPISAFIPTPGTKEFRDALSPAKSFLYECKKSKKIETYKFSFQPVEGELGVQVGVRKTGKQFQFLSLKSSALMAPNAAKEIYFKLVSNWFGNEDIPEVRQAYDAQVAKMASPPPYPPCACRPIFPWRVDRWLTGCS